MKRTFYSFSVEDFSDVKHKLLEWSNRFAVCSFLDNHHYNSPYNGYECLVAVGCTQIFKPGDRFFDSLSSFVAQHNDWIFGHFTYDIKNEVENLSSNNKDQTLLPDFFLFVPEIVIQLKENSISIGVLKGDASPVFAEILCEQLQPAKSYNAHFSSRVRKDEYASIIQKLKEHIMQGDCYEINYCQEFYAENTFINPADVYQQLAKASPNPFSCFYKLNSQYVLCASPERYIKKTGEKIISQPIKGTAPRSADALHDEQNKLALEASEKDRRENVIVVDLVRNDLSKVCTEGTVVVEELCEVYAFPTVYQMISTVSGQLRAEEDFSTILKATFPMGSMTGAPKNKVMQLIETYEKTKRGIYSGTIGYISPDKNFDFNVVIRSIVYNSQTGYISYHTGGGITSQSDPYQEYEECLLKAAAIFKVFSGVGEK